MATNAQIFAPPPRFGTQRTPKQKILILLASVAGMVLIVGGIVWMLRGSAAPPPKHTEFHSTRGMPYVDPTEKPVQAVVTLPKPSQGPVASAKQMVTGQAAGPAATLDPILNAPIAIKNDQGSPFLKEPTREQQLAKNEDESEGGDNDLSQSLKRSKLGPKSVARVDRNYLYEISAGRKIPCNRTVATNSQLPGFVSCDIPEDVYNDKHSVKLLPKGAHVFGEYKSAVLHGNNRLFVLWREIRTDDTPPIKIEINSPAADALGRAGMTGEVNNHLVEAFLATAVYTLLEAGPSLAQAAIQNGSHATNQFQFNSVAAPTQSLGGTILQDYMRRPPTLESNPGEPLMIYVGSDIDCSKAVELRLIGTVR